MSASNGGWGRICLEIRRNVELRAIFLGGRNSTEKKRFIRGCSCVNAALLRHASATKYYVQRLCGIHLSDMVYTTDSSLTLRNRISNHWGLLFSKSKKKITCPCSTILLLSIERSTFAYSHTRSNIYSVKQRQKTCFRFPSHTDQRTLFETLVSLRFDSGTLMFQSLHAFRLGSTFPSHLQILGNEILPNVNMKTRGL